MQPEEIKCGSCPMRMAYDKNPKSLKGRFWRWHINWCPGWKAYMNTLSEGDKTEIRQKYQIK